MAAHRPAVAQKISVQVDWSDVKLVPPSAGAFWTPRKPPPYDSTLPAYPVVYSEEEKTAQREAYQTHSQGLKDAIAAGKTEYTFPPGVYRSKEKIYMQVRHTCSSTNIRGIPRRAGTCSACWLTVRPAKAMRSYSSQGMGLYVKAECDDEYSIVRAGHQWVHADNG